MYVEPYRIHIAPDSELARSLEDAGETPVLLEIKGNTYRLVEEQKDENTRLYYWEEEPADDIWANYDKGKVKAALRDSVGALRNINRNELLDDIHQAREQNSHGRQA